MNDADYAKTHAKLLAVAGLVLEIDNLDAYLERCLGAPTNEHRDLAVAVANLQRTVLRQLAGLG